MVPEGQITVLIDQIMSNLECEDSLWMFHKLLNQDQVTIQRISLIQKEASESLILCLTKRLTFFLEDEEE